MVFGRYLTKNYSTLWLLFHIVAIPQQGKKLEYKNLQKVTSKIEVPLRYQSGGPGPGGSVWCRKYEVENLVVLSL